MQKRSSCGISSSAQTEPNIKHPNMDKHHEPKSEPNVLQNSANTLTSVEDDNFQANTQTETNSTEPS